MRESTLLNPTSNSLHVAIVMDGNGRWAAMRGLPRQDGHRLGAETVGTIVQAAASLNIDTLTLFAFSGNNWQRPTTEVTALLGLVENYLLRQAPAWAASGVRVRIIGRRDRIPPSLKSAIETTENLTAHSHSLDLRIAFDYSSRESILRAACWMLSSLEVSQAEFSRKLGEVTYSGQPSRDVDLLIRTGGERRLSDFLLWECAYAELMFSPKMWPEFQPADLRDAVDEFSCRERRFGQVPATKPSIDTSLPRAVNQ
jgi:undecaprenyl diphosphate synthase